MLVLASRSPRRSEILQQAGIPFVVRPADIDETPRSDEHPRDYVTRLARDKAMAVSAGPAEIVLGADTMVVIGGGMRANPRAPADAVRLLETLSGQRHDVITGTCLKTAARVIDDCSAT